MTDISSYIRAHSSPEGDYLYRLYRATNIHTIHGRMASGHVQGRLLKMLVEMIRPKNVLEVGTFSGYSASAWQKDYPTGARYILSRLTTRWRTSPVRGSKALPTPTK